MYFFKYTTCSFLFYFSNTWLQCTLSREKRTKIYLKVRQNVLAITMYNTLKKPKIQKMAIDYYMKKKFVI